MKEKKKYTARILLISVIVLFALVFSNKQLDTWLFGEARYQNPILRPGNIEIPNQRTLVWNDRSAYADSLCFYWSGEPIGDWKEDGKMTVPRILLGRLLSNVKIRETNEYITGLQPRGNTGSRWLFNPDGDYDFTLTPLTAILYLFDNKPEILYPETKKHLVEVLLTAEGGNYSDAVPGTLGRIKDSENHLLMIQGSRYLKNRYRMLHGNSATEFNNEQNGMEKHVLALLREITTIGLYEFNSVPYLGYTISAILNLEAFGSENVRIAARNSLDYLCFCYALGSYRFKYYPPFRRRLDRAKNTLLSKDNMTAFMKAWLSYHPTIHFYEEIGLEKQHGITTACMPYRPADEVVNLIFHKPVYFVKLGHGENSSPEIYSAGPGYLLSAGGVNRGKWSIIVARPVCLFLNDSAEKISEVFHINGKGKDFMKWNNTGVYKNFACSNGPVIVPDKFKPAAMNQLWKIYGLNDSLALAVHSAGSIGIMALFNNRNPTGIAEKLLESNPDAKVLMKQFQFPGGRKIEYDVNAPKNSWVIKTVDGKPADREFDKWPLIEGDLAK
jgi:hypothetical protein